MVAFLDLLAIVGPAPQPFIWGLPCDRRWLSLVTATDHLNTPRVEPVQEGFKQSPRHSAHLVPDDDSRDELLAHAIRRPLCLPGPLKKLWYIWASTPSVCITFASLCVGMKMRGHLSRKRSMTCVAWASATVKITEGVRGEGSAWEGAVLSGMSLEVPQCSVSGS